MRLPKEGEIWKYLVPGYENQLFKIKNPRCDGFNFHVELWTDIDVNGNKDPTFSRCCNDRYWWPNNPKNWELTRQPEVIEEYI